MGLNHRPNHSLLLWPMTGWIFCFLLIPLIFVFTYSFLKRGTYGEINILFNIDNYLRALDYIYLRIFWNSLKLACFTTLSCLIIGYPVAYVIATASKKLRAVLLVLVVIPFWTNIVVRTYAFKLFLSDAGPLVQWAQTLGFSFHPGMNSHSPLALWFGMVSNYLPFMVLPLFVAIDKFDFSLVEAARDLGANPFQVFKKILLPLTKPGIVSGCIFVFTPALGEFVIPDILAGGKTMLIGNLIFDQFLKTRDWPFGSALSLILIFTVMFSLHFYMRTEKK